MTDETNGAAQAASEDAAAAALEAEFNPPAEKPEVPADNAGAEPEAKLEEPEEKPEPKPKKTAQERIDELTWRVREGERREAALLDRLGKPAPATEPQPAAQQGDGKPDPDQYQDGQYDPQYIEDLTDWKAEQAVQRHASRTSAAQSVQQQVQGFESRVKEHFPDGEPEGLAAIRTMDELPRALQDIMLVSDVGPLLADHYGAKPAELARLSAMPLPLQAREITLMEAKLTAPAAPAAPSAKTTTDAPEPAPRARGAGGQFQVQPDTDDFASFEKLADAKLG